MKGKSLRKEFNKTGYIILRNFFSALEITDLLEEIKVIGDGDRTNNLNKGTMVFHSTLFSRSQKIQAFLSQPKVVDLLKQVIGPGFWVRWDQAVAKGPGAGTFPWHQDNGYTKLKDQHYQFWIALTRMTAENGGLWLQPGSHHQRSLPHKFVGEHAVYQGTPESPVFIEAQPGDVVLFSSFMLHSTTPNVSQETRWAYVIEFMSIEDYDPTLEPPYFVVAQNGKPQPEFVHAYKGSRNPINHLKYLGHGWSPKQLIPGWLKDTLKDIGIGRQAQTR